jgi:hypothetical protein
MGPADQGLVAKMMAMFTDVFGGELPPPGLRAAAAGSGDDDEVEGPESGAGGSGDGAAIEQ